MTARTTTRLAGAALALTLASSQAAGDWPHWRGPGFDGKIAGELAVWSAPEGPPRLWRREIGHGFSSVTIVGDRLYTAWAEDEREVVAALDRANGATVWKTVIDEAFENDRGGGPRSQPTVAGDRLLLVSGRGRLVALDRSEGRLLWQRDLVAELGAEIPIWGFAASPLVLDGKIFAPVGGEGQALAAFDLADGSLVWSAHDDSIGYSSPIPMELAGQPQIVALTGQSISGYSPDGRVLWTHPWQVVNNINIATPLQISQNRVFVSTSYDVGAALLEIAPTEEGQAAREIWRNKVLKNHFQDSVLHEGHLYGFDNAFLKCIVAATGEERWRHRGFGKGQTLLAGDRLLILGERGRLAVVRATPTGYEELAATELERQRYWTPPTLDRGTLYVRTERDLTAYDLQAGGEVAGAPEAAPGPAATAAAPGAPAAAELVRLNLAARGTPEAWAAVGTVRVSGQMNRNGRDSALTLWRNSAGQIRTEISFRGYRELFVWDGDRGWLDPLGGDPGGVVTGADLQEQLAIAETFLPWRDPWSGFERIESLGAAGSERQPTHRLRVTSNGQSYEWQLFAATHQIAQAERPVGERRLDTAQFDWRPVGGLSFPHYAEISFGTGMYSLTVEEIELGAEAAEYLFQAPEG